MARRLAEVFYEPTRNQGDCSALLRLNLGLNEQREIGNLALHSFDRKFLHGIETSDHSSHVDLHQLLRGDAAIPGKVNRLYYYNSDNLGSNGSLVLNGLSLEELESDCDRYFNSRVPPTLLSVVKAFTVDGAGGTINWKANGFSACLAYYLENFYIRVPFAQLERISERTQTGSVAQLDLLRPQLEALQAWYRSYLMNVSSCPTHRPITESYFLQLRAQGLPDGEESDLGNAFFSNYTYTTLKKNEQGIMKQARSA